MSRFELTRAALSDLTAIDESTFAQFGAIQVVKNQNLFEEAFRRLGERPRIGHTREDLAPGKPFRFWPVLGRFLIVYQPTESGIQILRVLDGTRDIHAIFTTPADPDAPPTG